LIDHVDLVSGGYETRLRQAFARACRRFGYDLLIVPAGPLSGSLWPGPSDRVYDMIGAESVAGLVLVSAGLASVCGAERFAKWCQRRAPLPRCSLGMAVEGVPSVVADNLAGMRVLLEHQIEVHGCRRIAFLRGTAGNADAETRYRLYREVLARYEISHDPALEVEGAFTIASGIEATTELVARGVSFDALVCASDGMALGALQVLQARGIRVPRDVALTGFDDLVMGRLSDPTLTTVQQPLGHMAALAVEILVRQIRGVDVPLCSELPTSFIARESCGCGLNRIAQPVRALLSSPADFVRRNAARLADLMVLSIPSPDETLVAVAGSLLEGVLEDLEGREGAFAEALQWALNLSADDADAPEELQTMVSALHAELGQIASHPLQGVWTEARRQIALAMTRNQALQRVQVELRYQRLRETGERLSMLLDSASLRELLARELLAMQLSNAVILLCRGQTSEQLETLICISRGEVRESSPEPFRAAQLLPSELDLAGEPRVWLVLPLIAENTLLGLSIFDAPGESAAYEILRGQIAAALRTCALHAEIVEKTALHERSVRERQATAERMSSLSALAGGVAHDLNNALGPLIGLSELVSAELEQLARRHSFEADEMCSDLAMIRGASLRASQTIKDLLTLSRQGKIKKEPVDINAVIAACKSDWLHSPNAENSALELRVGPYPEPLVVLGSEAHLIRALGNLLSNAAESITGPGRVVIEATRIVIDEPWSGFESIEPGDYAVIRVSDTGNGIASQDLARIFEPFFSTKRLGTNQGSGLGLAIVHGVVKEHDGFVNVEPVRGSGTLFSIYLRRISAIAKRSDRPAERRGHGRVLVVDDELVQLRTARRILGHLGYEVITCTGGEAALRLVHEAAEQAGARAAETPFDLVILDMQLNEVGDGLQVLEQIRTQFPAQSGLIVSGHAPDERGRQAAQARVPWLAKPYTIQSLAAAVDDALAATSTRSAAM
jgi:DNA-binding LacI/PurR family transcriptional regulator/C4-dicarboxylate-specific signal transduction histidine kinase/ActR/RegA family two-component response regulator